jgi:hypothetical protein
MGSEVEEAAALGDGAADALAVGVAELAGEGVWPATLLLPPQAATSKVARTATCTGAGKRRRVSIGKRRTTFCALGYVSGTIQPLKQGADPHPQGSARTGCNVRTAPCCPFCFIWMEE